MGLCWKTYACPCGATVAAGACVRGVVRASACVFEGCRLCVVAHAHSLVCEVRKEKS